MQFNIDDKIMLVDEWRYEFQMTVIGQRGNYVALGTDDYIEAYTIGEHNGEPYLATINDGGPSVCYKFYVVPK